MKAKRNWKNIKAYFVGNLRFKIYHSKFYWLLPKHIREQYRFRILKMRDQCYMNGYCMMCGCTTTNLQMANKECDGKCYAPMMNKRDWINFIHTVSLDDLIKLSKALNYVESSGAEFRRD